MQNDILIEVPQTIVKERLVEANGKHIASSTQPKGGHPCLSIAVATVIVNIIIVCIVVTLLLLFLLGMFGHYNDVFACLQLFLDLVNQSFTFQVPTVCTQEVVRAVPKVEAHTRERSYVSRLSILKRVVGQVHEIIKEVPKIEYQACGLESVVALYPWQRKLQRGALCDSDYVAACPNIDAAL